MDKLWKSVGEVVEELWTDDGKHAETELNSCGVLWKSDGTVLEQLWKSGG